MNIDLAVDMDVDFTEDFPGAPDADESQSSPVVWEKLADGAIAAVVDPFVVDSGAPFDNPEDAASQGITRTTMATGVPPIVPLPRTLVFGSKGRDVLAVKRALSRAGFMQWGAFTTVYGEHCRRAVHAFQKSVGLAPAGYGPRTHEALRRAKRKGATGWAFDAYSIQIMEEVYAQLRMTPETRVRLNILSMARRLYAHRGSIQYSQARPFPLVGLAGAIPSRLDCSGFATVCHYAAGARNPNVQGGQRLPWNGLGYTGTLLAGGTRTSRENLKLGDLIFYGFSRQNTPAFPYGSPTHVAVYAGDEMVYSMGSYPMRFYHYRYRHDVHSFVTYRVV